MNNSHKGVVVISAGVAGIGLACARALKSEGYLVLSLDIDKSAVRAYCNEFGKASAITCDLSDPSEVEQAYKYLMHSVESLDVLINNVGIAGPQQPLEEIEIKAWQQTIDTDLNSFFYLTRMAIPRMKQQRSGLIINMSSSAGRQGCALRSPYVAAKWAAIGLSKTWAMELGAWKIRVNALCPGSVIGDRIERVIQRDSENRGIPPEEIRNAYQRQSSLREFVSADDIAAMVCFLAGPGGRMISGQVIGLDGHTETLTSSFDI